MGIIEELTGNDQQLYEAFVRFTADRLGTIGFAELPTDVAELDGGRGDRVCHCGGSCRAKSTAADAVADLIADNRPGNLANYLQLEGQPVVVGEHHLGMPVTDPHGRHLAVIVALAEDLPADWRAALYDSAQEGATA